LLEIQKYQTIRHPNQSPFIPDKSGCVGHRECIIIFRNPSICRYRVCVRPSSAKGKLFLTCSYCRILCNIMRRRSNFPAIDSPDTGYRYSLLCYYIHDRTRGVCVCVCVCVVCLHNVLTLSRWKPFITNALAEWRRPGNFGRIISR